MFVSRRDTVNEDNHRTQELLHFSSSVFGELAVHKGKMLGETWQTWHKTFLLFCKYCLLVTRESECLFLTGESERLGRSVYCGFEANSGEFSVIYEWSLRWSKKMGKFFTSQEKGKLEGCKKQASSCFCVWCVVF